tara:strand:- start:991 stop:1968 length:978 start_codon:yes stop_codon:yes gene_type:complete
MDIIKSKQIFISGGLGFIGYNLIQYLIRKKYNGKIIVYDNNSISNNRALKSLSILNNVSIVIGDLLDYKKTKSSMQGSDIVIHLAANSDISKGVFNPSIDFDNTIVATKNVLISMLENEINQIVFPSGSGVYGDVNNINIPEEYGPLIPVSHYGASKLSAEALISSFVHMHDFTALIFRFANVIGPNQTHGVAYDFIRKIIKNSDELNVLGNGTQLKSYIHVDDIISGIFIALEKSFEKLQIYNLSTDDAITVKDIAKLVVSKMGNKTKIIYGNTNYGWRGDVPKISLSSEKIKKMGWNPNYTTREAMKVSIDCMLNEIEYINKS